MINIAHLFVMGGSIFLSEPDKATKLADFTSRSAAAQALHLLRDPQWSPPFGKWYTTGFDAVRIAMLRGMLEQPLPDGNTPL